MATHTFTKVGYAHYTEAVLEFEDAAHTNLVVYPTKEAFYEAHPTPEDLYDDLIKVEVSYTIRVADKDHGTDDAELLDLLGVD